MGDSLYFIRKYLKFCINKIIHLGDEYHFHNLGNCSDKK